MFPHCLQKESSDREEATLNVSSIVQHVREICNTIGECKQSCLSLTV